MVGKFGGGSFPRLEKFQGGREVMVGKKDTSALASSADLSET